MAELARVLAWNFWYSQDAAWDDYGIEPFEQRCANRCQVRALRRYRGKETKPSRFVRLSDDGRIVHTRTLQEHAFEHGDLHAVSCDLDDGIEAPQMFECPVLALHDSIF